ncbi:MAG: hypothetical protein MUF54_11665, partial [Polyangiaceae bacterium]|nr:hypothetical protein [Polyangiaceae bacterium]
AAVVDATGDELALGGAIAVAAGAVGLVAVTRGDELVVVPSQKGRPAPIEVEPRGMSPRSAALVDGPPASAYWVSGTRLVRRTIAKDGTTGGLEELARDAAQRTTVAAARATGPMARDVVVYVGGAMGADAERSGRVWVEGHGTRPISREAGGATAVALVGLGGGRFAIVTLDGRVAMSPVHAVYLELDSQGAPHLGEDRVVHVAGPADWHTSIAGIQVGVGPVVFLPLSRDNTRFGLMSLVIGIGDGEAPSRWVDYANGLEPAPLAVAMACQRPTVAFVRPDTADPASPRVLEVGHVDEQGQVFARKRLAVASKIAHVTMYTPRASGDAWVVYVTDAGLRARAIPCG